MLYDAKLMAYVPFPDPIPWIQIEPDTFQVAENSLFAMQEMNQYCSVSKIAENHLGLVPGTGGENQSSGRRQCLGK